MKIKKCIATTKWEDIEIEHFDEYIVLPLWVFDYDSCEKCGRELSECENSDFDEFKFIVRARHDKSDYSFCRGCWHEHKKEIK